MICLIILFVDNASRSRSKFRNLDGICSTPGYSEPSSCLALAFSGILTLSLNSESIKFENDKRPQC